jgi:hypothetical protein
MLFKALEKYRFVIGEEDKRLDNLVELGYCVQNQKTNKHKKKIADNKKNGEFFRLFDIKYIIIFT